MELERAGCYFVLAAENDDDDDDDDISSRTEPASERVVANRPPSPPARRQPFLAATSTTKQQIYKSGATRNSKRSISLKSVATAHNDIGHDSANQCAMGPVVVGLAGWLTD